MNKQTKLSCNREKCKEKDRDAKCKMNDRHLTICQEPYQFDSVEHFSLFTDLLYVHLWEKNSVTVFTQATTLQNS